MKRIRSAVLLPAALLVLTAASTASAQESGVDACSNGLDDDSDGLVDYNDPDCECAADLFATFEVTSLIRNPSFEDLDVQGCPTSISQITGHAQHWSQATSATSDYFACGYYYSGFGSVQPPNPAGDAWVGALSNGNYIEYIGNTTVEPIVPGTAYTLEFWVAVPTPTSYGGRSTGDIVVFGTNTPSFPINTTGDLEASGAAQQDVLARIPVDLEPTDGWVKVSTSFTVDSQYAGIIIGPGTGMTHPDTGYVHLMFDEININSTISFSTNINVDGDSTDGYALSAPAIDGVSYQWYLDGVAIEGAVGMSYDIPQDQTARGSYSVRIDDGEACSFTEEDEPVIIDDPAGPDQDLDSIIDEEDDCPSGTSDWLSTPESDRDGDGCRDADEDEDDDNDGIPDGEDDCATGVLDWVSNPTSDTDADGCRDEDEDEDDDNDGVGDDDDDCATGDLDWSADSATDLDADGCQDDGEDQDDDNDGVTDSDDDCDRGTTGWSSATSTDHDSDGCQDADDEDQDDDND
ncbi:MAG: hypothetical protein ACJA00_005127, partial [Myxococcota bacterium]